MKTKIKKWYFKKLVAFDLFIFRAKKFIKKMLLVLFSIELVLYIGIFIGLELANQPIVYHAKASELTQDEQKPVIRGETAVREKIEEIGANYGLSRKDRFEMLEVMRCETGNTFDPEIRSNAKYKDGTREKSWGLAQIHSPAHPHITHDQMTDPEFSIEFMAKNFKKGNKSMWSCYTKLKNQKAI